MFIGLIENKWFKNRKGVARRMPRNNDQEFIDPDILDPDVKEEEQRVANLGPQELEIRTYLLNKIYRDRKITSMLLETYHLELVLVSDSHF